MENPRFEFIPIAKIHPSNTNPRKRFPAEWIDELTSSIKDVGVMQPILVRKHPEVEGDFQIVSGECRYRASVAAGLEEMPAMIRELTDGQMLKLQILENLKRQDVHPMEQAEGFQYLLEHEGYKAEQLADEIGVSRSTIYASLKLCALCTFARDAFYESKLTASTALLIARIPGEKLQTQAVKEITKLDWNDEPMSFRSAVRHIRQRYTLNLAKAAFPITDAKLLEGTGTCNACPKRSGNCPELFSDIDSADVCTDPNCFQEKTKAFAVLSANGREVITGKAGDKIFPYNVQYSNDEHYVTPNMHFRSGDVSGTYEELLGDALEPLIKTVVTTSGDIGRVVDKAAAQKLIQEKHDIADLKAPSTPSWEAEQKARAEALQAENNRRQELLPKMFAAINSIASADLSPLLEAHVVEFVYETLGDEPLLQLLHIHGINRPENADDDDDFNEDDWITAQLTDLAKADPIKLLIESKLLEVAKVYYLSGNGEDSFFYQTAKVLGVPIEPATAEPASPPPSAAQAKEQTAPETDGQEAAQPEAQTAAADPAAPAEDENLPPGFAKAKKKALARKAKEQKQKVPAKAGGDDSAAAAATA